MRRCCRFLFFPSLSLQIIFTEVVVPCSEVTTTGGEREEQDTSTRRISELRRIRLQIRNLGEIMSLRGIWKWAKYYSFSLLMGDTLLGHSVPGKFLDCSFGCLDVELQLAAPNTAVQKDVILAENPLQSSSCWWQNTPPENAPLSHGLFAPVRSTSWFDLKTSFPHSFSRIASILQAWLTKNRLKPR